jgi:hypothetical protein
MGLLYKVTPKDLLDSRNKIFTERGIPALKRNGYERSPFPESLFGRNNLGDYTYELCRLKANSHLEIIVTHIAKGDRWIQIYLNIFHLRPDIYSLDQLNNIDGMQFRVPPNSFTRMRLRSDDFKGMPLFNTVHYKIKSFYTEIGFRKREEELSMLIERDMNNINHFIRRWYELHQPLITDWGGSTIDNNE